MVPSADSTEGDLCRCTLLWSLYRETFHFSPLNISEGQSSLPFIEEFSTLILHMASLLHSILCLRFWLSLEAFRAEVLTTTQNSWGFP